MFSFSFYLFIYLFWVIFISWRLTTLQYCSGFCHTLTWISHGFTCVPHPEPASHLPPHLIPLGHPSGVFLFFQNLLVEPTPSLTWHSEMVLEAHRQGAGPARPGIPGWLSDKQSTCNAGATNSIPGLGRSLCRRKWQCTPVFWHGKSHGQRSLVGGIQSLRLQKSLIRLSD